MSVQNFWLGVWEYDKRSDYWEKSCPFFVNFYSASLFLGNLFQLTYNAVDSIIVGHFVGKEALAAVGICNPVSTLMILFWTDCVWEPVSWWGFSMERKIMRLCTDRSVQLCCLVRSFRFFLTLVCVIFAVPILLLLQVDPSIMDMTVQYLRIIFLGLMFTFLYNFFFSRP